MLKLAFSEEGNNHMVLAIKIPPSFTAEMVVDYYAGKLFDGVLTISGKFEPPPQCNPRYTVQVGKFNVFLDGSKLQDGQLHPGARTYRSYKYLTIYALKHAIYDYVCLYMHRSLITRHFY